MDAKQHGIALRRAAMEGAILLAAGLLATPTNAERTITDAAYLDKLRGMWFGQLIGNHTGRPFEGQYCTREAAPDSAFAWVIKTSYADPWTGDDDTSFEYLYLHCLETYGLDPSFGQIQSEWDAHVSLSGIYIANRQAKFLMTHGFAAPLTGSYRYNMHAYAIDSQITTESLGALSPGIRQWAIESAGKFGGVTNEGFSLHAAEFYAAMYAAAAFESDVETVVALGQASIPTSSRTWRAIQDVRDWCAEDMADEAPDWRETRRKIYDDYHGAYDHGRYRYWIESTINVANTVLALLYGGGDFEETVRIAVLAGYDADCNPATAGGLIGMLQGYDALPTDLTGPSTDWYRVLYRPGLPEYDTISGIATRLRAVAEQVIVANGGTVGGVYTLPDADPVAPEPELPDPSGPTDLVAAVLNAGGTVGVSASIDKHNPAEDRDDLESIIDGIVDLRYDGHLPYETYDGENEQPAGGDFYQITFSCFVRLDSLTYYEGDIRWDGINNDPRVNEPWGGYFLNLSVEVRTAQGWAQAQDLQLSEPLDPYALYQVIDLSFDPIVADAVRIRGDAGGARQYTAIVELVCRGALACDFNGDNAVDLTDVPAFVGVLLGLETDPLAVVTADANGDGVADGRDIQPFAQAAIGGS